MEAANRLPGMDRRIAKKPFWRRYALVLALATSITISLAALYRYGANAKLEVDRNSVTISAVTYGEFQEYVAMFGKAKPSGMVFLDTRQGGRVKRIHKRPGDAIRAGALIIELSNATIEMDVLQRQTSLSEQQTALNRQQMDIEQRGVELTTNLLHARHRTDSLLTKAQRSARLAAADAINVEERERIDADLVESRELTALYEQQLEGYTSSSKRMLADIEQARRSLNRNMGALTEILEGLKIAAPIDGVLDMKALEVGETIAANEQMGRVYSPDSFGVEVRADEIHAGRISESQVGSATIEGAPYRLEVTKLHPSVQGGTFTIDMKFAGAAPSKLKPGQRIEVRLELGRPEKVLRVPVGPFHNDSGGRYLYVVNAVRTTATRVPVTLGRKNPEFFEVVQGLSPGMSVITSGYSSFGNAPEITLRAPNSAQNP